MQEGEKVVRIAVVARGDAAELLELVDSSLDEIAVLVEVRIEGAWAGAAFSGWDNSFGPAGFDSIEKGTTVVALIGNHPTRRETRNQIGGLCDVVELAAGQDEA